MPGWLILLIVAALVVTLVVWVLFDDAVARVESGQLGLVLLYGKATDKVLPPGPHLVLAFRRRMIEIYPSLELAYRAGRPGGRHAGPRTGGAGPARGPRRPYGGRRLLHGPLPPGPGALRSVHERFGPQGIWSRPATSVAGPCVPSSAERAPRGRRALRRGPPCARGGPRRGGRRGAGGRRAHPRALRPRRRRPGAHGGGHPGRGTSALRAGPGGGRGRHPRGEGPQRRRGRGGDRRHPDGLGAALPRGRRLARRGSDPGPSARAVLPGPLGRPEEAAAAPDQVPEAAPATGEVTGETTGETSGQ